MTNAICTAVTAVLLPLEGCTQFMLQSVAHGKDTGVSYTDLQTHSNSIC